MPRKSKATKGLLDGFFKLFKNIIKNFKKLPIIIQLGILLCLLLILFKKKVEPFENNSSKAEITFFHMEGCGHCQKMKPEWTNFENDWSDKQVIVNDKEQGEAKDLCQKYNIKGFPTILFTVNGDVPQNSQNQEHVYSGDRTSSSFKEWANEMKESFLS